MNNGCGQLGAIQTRGTCWFYSILNGFILSGEGQKILYNKLKEFYKKLKPTERSYFDDDFNAPCPMSPNLTKTKEIYFWKFIDQYLCFMSGPRAASLKAGKSAEILGGMSLQGTIAKEAKGGKGAFPQVEIAKILDHVGFAKDYYIKYAQDPPKFHAARNPQFVVVMKNKYYKTEYMEEIPKGLLADPKYELVCASLIIENTLANKSELHKAHAVAGFVCNGQGYIYDSNQRKIFKCKWWDRDEFIKVVNNEVGAYYSFFRNGQINIHMYAFAIFARKGFTDAISPACLVKYKMKTPEGYNFTSPNLGQRINNMNWLKPAERVALKRRWARTEHRAAVYMTQNTFNSIVSGAKNRTNAYRQLEDLLKAGYKYKVPDYLKFVNKVTDKFSNKKVAPVPEPKPKTPSPSPKTKRAGQIRTAFAEYWKGMNANNRQVVRNYIATYKSPSPTTKVLTKFFAPAQYTLANAKRNVNALKTAKARAEFYKKGTVGKGLKPSNLVELTKYIKMKNQEARNARAAKKSVAKPSPAKPVSALNAAKRNVNALKTAKARKEYRRNRAANLSQNNWMELIRYINLKNYEARQARSAKRAAKA